MTLLMRVVVGLAGLLALAAVLLMWFQPESAVQGLGLAITNSTGLATVRADIAGFFGTCAFFALFAAIRAEAHYILPVLVLQLFAITGRLVNITLTGWNPIFLPPMLIESATIAIFVVAYRVFSEVEPDND